MERINQRNSMAVLFIMLLQILIMVLVFDFRPYIPLFIGDIWVSLLLLKLGIGFKDIIHMMIEGIKKALTVIAILLLIGTLTAFWRQNGILATLITYGFEIINPRYFVPTSFILVSIISMVLGSAIGTSGTVGIVLMGISQGLDVPKNLVAGSLISGAFLGDRSSPLAGNISLLAGMTDERPDRVFRFLMTTAIPAFILVGFIYFLTGFQYSSSGFNANSSLLILDGLKNGFIISPWLFIPPALIIGLALLRVPTLKNLTLGVIISFTISLIEGKRFFETLRTAVFGFVSSNPDLKIFSGGGLLSMGEVTLVLLTATSLSGMLEGTGIISLAFKDIVGKINRPRPLIVFTMLLSFIISLITCNQALGVILTSSIMRPEYDRLHVDRIYLARGLADSCIVLAGIIPWNMAAYTPSMILGVPVTGFMPYSFFNLLLPLVSIASLYLPAKSEVKFYTSSV
ncbi:MAG: Na+/H+ antiporter NhaC family protein [Thermoanaerobacteraceae bacterium]|nr:Na+/H+ antiporter NhaC family protein [Thermoanaerobacteraceae bacterium]